MKWTVRKNGAGETEERNLTPYKALKHQCRECFTFSKKPQKEYCTSKLCSLYPWSPYGLQMKSQKSNMTEEQRNASRERMKILRQNQLKQRYETLKF